MHQTGPLAARAALPLCSPSAAATERVSRLSNGHLLYRLKRRWRNGTTPVVTGAAGVGGEAGGADSPFFIGIDM